MGTDVGFAALESIILMAGWMQACAERPDFKRLSWCGGSLATVQRPASCLKREFQVAAIQHGMTSASSGFKVCEERNDSHSAESNFRS